MRSDLTRNLGVDDQGRDERKNRSHQHRDDPEMFFEENFEQGVYLDWLTRIGDTLALCARYYGALRNLWARFENRFVNGSKSTGFSSLRSL